MARVMIPGVGEFERFVVRAPWGGEEFVRYAPIKLPSGAANEKASRYICETRSPVNRPRVTH